MANAAPAAERMKIGIDLGDRRSHACVLEPVVGDVVERFVFDSTADALTKALASRPPGRVVIEAGTNSRWASLSSHGAVASGEGRGPGNRVGVRPGRRDARAIPPRPIGGRVLRA